MAKKDVAYKRFMDFNDVFSDIVNVLLFRGEQRILPEQLRQGMSRSYYHVGKDYLEQERDAKKYWNHTELSITCFGIENQTTVDAEAPIRTIAYDGADYRDQLRARAAIRRRRVKRRYLRRTDADVSLELPPFFPVCTLFLYFGDSRWNKSRHLRDCLKVPDGLEEYVPDYRINVFEIAYLSEKQVSQFRSDFRFVAEYFVQNRLNKDGKETKYILTMDHLVHVEEFLELMEAITGDSGYADDYHVIIEEGRNATMETVMQRRAAKSREDGRKEGRQEGILETLSSLVKKGLISLADAAKEAGLSPAEFQSKMAEMK